MQLDAPALLARLPEPQAPAAVMPELDAEQVADLPVQQARSFSELQARRQTLQQNLAQQQVLELAGPAATPLAPLTAAWAGEALVLARRVPPQAGGPTIEGCIIDWPRLRADLLAAIADLLPHAGLEPAADAASTDQRLLAAIPARLVPGAVPAAVAVGWSPLRGTLAAAWLAMALAAAAVGALLASVLALSERRAAFVSSVTHELRTPLTTFRLYSGLLEEGMVPAAEVPTYHTTLRREADRLTHLVENVLAYARLERGRHAARLAPVSVGNLLDTVTPRPAERATQAGFDWRLHADAATRRLTVTTDPAAVEQVLFTLVDNACKYARGPGPAAIEVAAAARGRSVAIAIRDYGPGVAAREAAWLFEPFRKSARDAAEGAAGVGLGLALSRRLARQMGGDLAYEPPADGGARFVLTLPLAAAADVARP
jgi:signal transduction histidine kinase